MRFRAALVLTAAALMAGPAIAQPVSAAPPPAPLPDALKDPHAQESYVLGLNIGQQLQGGGLDDVDTAALVMGVEDAMAKARPKLSDDQIRDTTIRLRADVQAHRQAQAAMVADTNKAQGEAFLKANAAKPGVVTLPSGLQYEVITPGTGPKPTLSDTVTCNYRGALLSGAEFDSSYSRGQPARIQVAGVIKGWTEALQLMPVGSKWRLFVPADLAYGENGAGPDIGPNAVLVFEVELLSIEGKN